MNNYSRQLMFNLPSDIPKVEGREITKAIYLLGTKSSYYSGHAALMLIDKEGNGLYYSTVFSIEKNSEVLRGEDAPCKIYRQELSKPQVTEYFKTGKIPGIDKSYDQMFYLKNYDKYIIIPIKDRKQGTDIYSKAEFIYKNPGKYNLYSYNCNHVTQDILEAGKLNFTPSKTDKEEIAKQLNNISTSIKRFKFVSALYWIVNSYRKGWEMGVIPNGAFWRGVKWAKENNYDYGKIDPQNPKNPLKKNSNFSSAFNTSKNTKSKDSIKKFEPEMSI